VPFVDLAFRLTGPTIPVDHGYALYSAVSRLLPGLHTDKEIGIHPIRGRYVGDGGLQLTSSSRLTIRLPDDRIRDVLKLAGKRLELDGYQLQVGIPEVRALRASAVLYSRLVTIKGFMEVEPFLAAARRQLNPLGVSAELTVGERRTLRVKDKQVLGFEVSAVHVDAAGSLRLQERGIGGRRHMGCGMFVPMRERKGPRAGTHPSRAISEE
jgi:CRISPR-associated protein Cas6